MKELLKNITTVFAKNNFTDLVNAANEKKLLYLYSFYHYYFGDDDRIDDILDHCNYTKEFGNFAQGFFEQDSYDERIIDILVPYYVEENQSFDLGNVKYMISVVQTMVAQMKHKTFSLSASQSKLRDFWDPQSEDKLLIRVITNHHPDFDEKNDVYDEISNISPLFNGIKFEIIFGDDIEDEIAQLTSDKKCVESSELTLDRPNNYLTYGEEESIITNIKASSLKENYQKYGKAGLFAMNLRFYIANKKVDEGLEESIRNKGENFWYYNNGIIIVCDDFKVEGDKVKLKNFSIVNGGQTTRMIGYIPFTKDFAVSCKIIRNKYKDNAEANARFVSEIAEASNTQKPINSTDLIANRYEQRYLKDKLAENGIFMQIKRGDAAMANLKENYPEAWQRTKSDELGQLIYATVCQKPGTARNSKDKIFSDKNKYQLVFGNPTAYNMDFIKDLMYLKTYYKKWSAKVTKDPSCDDMKKGLAKNGYFYFSAAALLMAKFAFSKELTDGLKSIGIISEKGNYIISQKTFNHRLFNDTFIGLENKMYQLFEVIYDRYVGKEYGKAKNDKPDLVYSNFTKTDKNYTLNIASNIYDDFVYEINGRVAGVLKPLLYSPRKDENDETSLLVKEAFDNYDNRSKDEEEDVVDTVGDLLKEKLTEFRTETYKAQNIKAYEIFTNVELKALCTLRPRTTFELMQLNCFKSHPRRKIRYYGNKIVAIINEVCGDKK